MKAVCCYFNILYFNDNILYFTQIFLYTYNCNYIYQHTLQHCYHVTARLYQTAWYSILGSAIYDERVNSFETCGARKTVE